VRRRSQPSAAAIKAADNYFDDMMVSRQRLLWTIATRRQLERWEALVADQLREQFASKPFADVWAGEIEHHFALVAARNLLHALDLPPVSGVSIDPIMRAELKEGRDLHEHWTENMPVFNVTPRPRQPRHRSGRDFASRNTKSGPYFWPRWGNETGAQLLPHVSAPALHELLDEVEAEVLSSRPELARFVPQRAPSPWVYMDGEWWPKPDDA
jgi:hypothetical protein